MISFYRPTHGGALDLMHELFERGGVVADAVCNLGTLLATMRRRCIKQAVPVQLELA